MTSMLRWSVGLLLLLLVACSSRGSGVVVQCDQQFWNGTFGTCLPQNWKVLSQEALRSAGVPGETVAAFQLISPKGGQFDTVTVTQEALTQPLSTTEYSKANIVAVSALPEYKLLDQQTVYVDGQESAMHVFSARPVADSPVRRYYQLSAVAGQVGYTFTGAFPLSVETSEADQMVLILKNVTFTNPAGKKS